MAFKDGIFSMFGGNSQNQQAQQQQQPTQPHTLSTPHTPNPNGSQFPNQNQQQQVQQQNGNQQNQQQQQGQQQQNQNEPSALDRMMEMLKPTPQALEKAKQQTELQQQGILPKIAPDQIQQSLSGANFTQGISQELLGKAMSGQDPAAFMEVLNSVARNAVGVNLQMAHGLVEQGVKTGTERFGSTLDSRLNDFQLRNHTSENPVLNHPMAKGMITQFAKSAQNANPNLSHQEAMKAAETAFMDFAKMLNPTQQQADPNQQQQAAGTDWEKYLQS